MTRAARAIHQMEAALSDAQAVFTPTMRRAIDEMIATLFEASNRQTVLNQTHTHALDLVEAAKREKLPSLERVAKFADTASATEWALIYLFLRDNYREAIVSEQRPERVAFDQFLAGIAVAAGTGYSKTGDISQALAAIDKHGITPVATAMLLHLAETIRANKAVRLTIAPDNYGLQIVQVADAILDRLPKGSV